MKTIENIIADIEARIAKETDDTVINILVEQVENLKLQMTTEPDSKPYYCYRCHIGPIDRSELESVDVDINKLEEGQAEQFADEFVDCHGPAEHFHDGAVNCCRSCFENIKDNLD